MNGKIIIPHLMFVGKCKIQIGLGINDMVQSSGKQVSSFS